MGRFFLWFLNVPVIGFYIYTEASNPQQKDHKAGITLPKIPTQELKCLQFWYHMYGSDTGTLTLYGHHLWHKQSIWSRKGRALKGGHTEYYHCIITVTFSQSKSK